MSVEGVPAAVLGHALWGLYPVVARLATSFVSPSVLSLVAVLPAALFGIPLCLSPQRRTGIQPLRYRDSFLKDWRYWACVFSAFARTSLNLLTAKYARAVTNQTAMLLTPFCVAFLSYGFPQLGNPDRSADAQLPPRTWRSMLVSFLGAFLIVWNPDVSQLFATAAPEVDSSALPGPSPADKGDSVYGLGLALLGPVTQALYMVLVGPVTLAQEWTVGESIFYLMSPSIVLSLAMSVAAGDDLLLVVRELYQSNALFVVAMVMAARNFGHYFQLTAVRDLGAAFVSTLLPSRLLVTISCSVLFTGEGVSLVQLLGAGAVMGSVWWYLQARVEPRT